MIIFSQAKTRIGRAELIFWEKEVNDYRYFHNSNKTISRKLEGKKGEDHKNREAIKRSHVILCHCGFNCAGDNKTSKSTRNNHQNSHVISDPPGIASKRDCENICSFTAQGELLIQDVTCERESTRSNIHCLPKFHLLLDQESESIFSDCGNLIFLIFLMQKKSH